MNNILGTQENLKLYYKALNFPVFQEFTMEQLVEKVGNFKLIK
mgnify:CR=1 FL=1